MKRLQKHQAFEAELSANEPRIKQIQEESVALLSKPQHNEGDIRQNSDQLLTKWRQLASASQGQSRALEEARDLLDFNQLCERVLVWIREKVHKFDNEADETLNWLQEKEAMQVIAEQEDLSQADLQTIMNLLQRHDEFVRGLLAVEKQVNDLSREAGRLESQFPDTKDHLEVRRQEMEQQLKDVLSAAKKDNRN